MKPIIFVLIASTALLALSANGSGELERYDKEGELVTFSQEELECDRIDKLRVVPNQDITEIFADQGVDLSSLTGDSVDISLSHEMEEHIYNIIEENTRGVVEIINEELDTVLIEEDREFAFMLLGPYLFSATRSAG